MAMQHDGVGVVIGIVVEVVIGVVVVVGVGRGVAAVEVLQRVDIVSIVHIVLGVHPSRPQTTKTLPQLDQRRVFGWRESEGNCSN